MTADTAVTEKFCGEKLMKTVIVGGVAGGASAAARLRRLDERAQIVIFEKTGYISYANCGLPYSVGGEISDREALRCRRPRVLRGVLTWTCA